ncbi:MAG: RNA polymerase sporulation sigma factor SigK [Lachnospiraceae bacterium]|nr:RNA polymerase sporulation sigma factor SigK [Lachnospiraceae bacterium]
MQSFQKPLSAKEEQEYLKRCKTGDRQARDCLIERNLRLVAYIAKKYQANEREMDDLISIGTIGLIKGIDSFDESKKIRLATYCARCVDNEILMYLRANRKTRNDVYLYDSIGSDREGNEINLMDILEYEDEDVVEKVVRQGNLGKLEGYIRDTLTPREWDILKMRYGLKGEEEKTQREIAAIYGISRSYVSRIEKKALEKLRRRYEDNG